ncbi:MAG: SRPBCC domain-containing protein [Methylocella sp.]
MKRRIDAAPEKVFKAWTEPEKITRWFGPGQVAVLHAETDARAGGRYRIVARSRAA